MKKRSSKNLKITTRITLSTILGIVIPLIIVVAFSTIFLNTMTSYFNFSTVTTDSYSMLNQIQWSQTMTSISNELMSGDSLEVKKQKVTEFVSPLEKLGSTIYIEGGGKEIYSSVSKKKTIEKANAIVPIDLDMNINYFSENGIVIVNHAEDNDIRYLVLIANDDYTVFDVSERYTPQDFTALAFGKTGMVLSLIVLVFIISILVLSFITSRTISKPIKKLADGANEIANGNLDYIIDYKSTNEIGTTVDSFNHMTAMLKKSLEEQNRIEQSRKEMIAGLAHDLRTPLTSVKGYIEGLRDGIANTPEKQQFYLKTIYSSALNMERLLDELLTVSRLELGNSELDTKKININDFLDDCALELGEELKEEGFDFSYINKCEKDFYTLLDTERFARVIRNIVSNSIKYSKKDVKGKIELGAQSYSKSVIISIADNGIGLDAENLPRIFESFYRADPARTKTSEGSGLGLSVSKQLVELHGGQIWAAKNENDGLTIFITLKRMTEDADEKTSSDN